MSGSIPRDFPPGSLPSRLRSHRPPPLHQPGIPKQSATRDITQSTLDVFAQDGGIHFGYDRDILPRLQQVLREAWTDAPSAYPDPSWALVTALHGNFHRWTPMRGEVQSLSGIMEHQLFGLVHYFLDPEANGSMGNVNFKERYYEPPGPSGGTTHRARWNKGRKKEGVEADHVVTRTVDCYLEEDRVVMEKVPGTMGTPRVMSIVHTAKTGGLNVTVEAGMLCCDRVTIDAGGLQQISQLVEYMSTYNIPVGVLTNYDAYVLLVRTASNRFAISDIVYRDYGRQFPAPDTIERHFFAMTPLELLLALCLYSLQDEITLTNQVFKAKVKTHVSLAPKKGNKRKATERIEGDDEGGYAGPSWIQAASGQRGRAGGGGHPAEESWNDGTAHGQEDVTEDSPQSLKLRTPTLANIQANIQRPGPGYKLHVHLPEYPCLGATLVGASGKISFDMVSGLGDGWPAGPSVVLRGHDRHGHSAKHTQQKDMLDSQADLQAGSVDSSVCHDDSSLPIETGDITIHLVEQIGQGRTFHAFSTNLSVVAAQITHPIIAKIALLDMDVKSAQEALFAAKHEASILTGPLRTSQGTAVPLFLGLYVNARCVVSLLSHAGDRMDAYLGTDASDDDAWGWREEHKTRCELAYRQIHAAGVIHGDVETRHIRCGLAPHSDTAMIIDFDRALAVGRDQDVRVRRESARVRWILWGQE